MEAGLSLVKGHPCYTMSSRSVWLPQTLCKSKTTQDVLFNWFSHSGRQNHFKAWMKKHKKTTSELGQNLEPKLLILLLFAVSILSAQAEIHREHSQNSAVYYHPPGLQYVWGGGGSCERFNSQNPHSRREPFPASCSLPTICRQARLFTSKQL